MRSRSCLSFTTDERLNENANTYYNREKQEVVVGAAQRFEKVKNENLDREVLLMKTLTINNKMLQIVAAMLVVLMVGFSHLAQAAQTSPAFDHSRTGFLLKDVHTTLKCEQCHVDGIFKNTPKDCAGCHTTGSRVGA